MKLIVNKHILEQGQIKLDKKKKIFVVVLKYIIKCNFATYEADIYVLVNL